MEARCGEGLVVELGPGTGGITRALLENATAEEELVLIERDREMRRWLERRFPHAEVFKGEAAQIGAILDERTTGAPSVVVSSLPLRNMGEGQRDAIVRAGRRNSTGPLLRVAFGPVEHSAGGPFRIEESAKVIETDRGLCLAAWTRAG